jgi:hypothetical protein
MTTVAPGKPSVPTEVSKNRLSPLTPEGNAVELAWRP